MKVAFVLPWISSFPIGGYKIVYEYCNRISELGFDVTIIYIYNYNNKKDWRNSLRRIKYLYVKIKSHQIEWFKINAKIKQLKLFHYSDIKSFSFDAIFATAIETSFPVFKLPYTCGEKFYFIQSWESWGEYTDNQVVESLRLGFHNVVISKWLLGKCQDFNINASYIPNGLNLDFFKSNNDIESKNKYEVLMLGHNTESKGMKDGVEAAKIVKIKYPDLKLKIFSASKIKNLDLLDDDWIEVINNPTQYELLSLYNRASIFIAPSWLEGWGLTASEAMQCGCAVVATENGGHQNFAIDNLTALTVPIRSPASIARKIEMLIENDELRFKIAGEGNRFIQQFKWCHSVDKLVMLINDKCSK